MMGLPSLIYANEARETAAQKAKRSRKAAHKKIADASWAVHAHTMRLRGIPQNDR